MVTLSDDPGTVPVDQSAELDHRPVDPVFQLMLAI
jgi:hypothetical protein